MKKNLAALMDAYGLSLREQLDYGRETKRKRLLGGLATAVLSAKTTARVIDNYLTLLPKDGPP